MNNAQNTKQYLVSQAESLVVSIYESLACSDWTHHDCTPQELEDAVDELRELHGEPCVDGYAEAVDWASHLVAKRVLGTDEGTPISPEALTQHEEDSTTVLFRYDDDGDDSEQTVESRSYDYEGECAAGQKPVACLDTFRTFGYVVEHHAP